MNPRWILLAFSILFILCECKLDYTGCGSSKACWVPSRCLDTDAGDELHLMDKLVIKHAETNCPLLLMASTYVKSSSVLIEVWSENSPVTVHLGTVPDFTCDGKSPIDVPSTKVDENFFYCSKIVEITGMDMKTQVTLSTEKFTSSHLFSIKSALYDLPNSCPVGEHKFVDDDCKEGRNCLKKDKMKLVDDPGNMQLTCGDKAEGYQLELKSNGAWIVVPNNRCVCKGEDKWDCKTTGKQITPSPLKSNSFQKRNLRKRSDIATAASNQVSTGTPSLLLRCSMIQASENTSNKAAEAGTKKNALFVAAVVLWVLLGVLLIVWLVAFLITWRMDKKKKEAAKKKAEEQRKLANSTPKPPTPQAKTGFRIPASDIQFKGPLRMKKKFSGEYSHRYEGKEVEPQEAIKEVILDPALNEAVEVGEGVEEWSGPSERNESEKAVDKEFFKDVDIIPQATLDALLKTRNKSKSIKRSAREPAKTSGNSGDTAPADAKKSNKEKANSKPAETTTPATSTTKTSDCPLTPSMEPKSSKGGVSKK